MKQVGRLYLMATKLNLKYHSHRYLSPTETIKSGILILEEILLGEGIPIELRSQTYDRTAPCQICQTTDKLILTDIKIEKRVEFLPYLAGNISGSKADLFDEIKYQKIQPNFGLGLNVDLNKNIPLEVTLNPRFFSSRGRCHVLM